MLLDFDMLGVVHSLLGKGNLGRAVFSFDYRVILMQMWPRWLLTNRDCRRFVVNRGFWVSYFHIECHTLI